MSGPQSNAKYCPRCAVMNHADAAACRHCGRVFRTGADKPAEAGELHRTQMFHLPPLPLRQPPVAVTGTDVGRAARLRAWLKAAAHSPLLLTVGLLVVLILLAFAAAAYWDFFG